MPRKTRLYEDGARPGSGRLLFRSRRMYLLEKIGQTVHDERYEDIILQAVPPEYEMVRAARREAGLWAGRHSAHGTHYVRRQPFALGQR